MVDPGWRSASAARTVPRNSCISTAKPDASGISATTHHAEHMEHPNGAYAGQEQVWSGERSESSVWLGDVDVPADGTPVVMRRDGSSAAVASTVPRGALVIPLVVVAILCGLVIGRSTTWPGGLASVRTDQPQMTTLPVVPSGMAIRPASHWTPAGPYFEGTVTVTNTTGHRTFDGYVLLAMRDGVICANAPYVDGVYKVSLRESGTAGDTAQLRCQVPAAATQDRAIPAHAFSGVWPSLWPAGPGAVVLVRFDNAQPFTAHAQP